jgi:translocation and assembly module TamB
MSGSAGAPRLAGRVSGRGLGLRNVLQGVSLTDGTLDMVLGEDRARIERLSFKGGQGTLAVEGGATLGEHPAATLRVVAERFQLLGRIDRRLVASGNAQLALDAGRLALDGAFQVDEGLFDLSRSDAPTLDDDVAVHRSGAEAGPAAEAAATTPLPAPLRMAQVAVKIDLGQKLQLRGKGVDTGLRGALVFSSPGGRPALNGVVRTVDGRYAAYGQKLEITRGEFSFNGALANPRLDVLAIRPNLDVLVGVRITGSADNPRIRLYSEPELADYDRLSWLVLGRSPDGLGSADTALLQRAAFALLAGGDAAGPTDALFGALGLTDFSLRQSGDGDARDTIVSLGKQLSRRWYVGYERGVHATTGTWQLIYRIAQRFTLRAQSGEDNALDVIWTWRW